MISNIKKFADRSRRAIVLATLVLTVVFVIGSISIVRYRSAKSPVQTINYSELYNLAETGAVSFMFSHVGLIEYDAKVGSADAMLEAAIDAGADDVQSSDAGHEVYAGQETFRDVAAALEKKFGEARKAAMVWKPQNTIAVDDETGEKLLKLMDLLNEHDDVQNVYANFEISDALVAKMGG